MWSRNNAWFQGVCCALVVMTLPYVAGREAAEAAARMRAVEPATNKAAATLGIDPRRLTDPAAVEAEEAAKTAAKRAAALEKLKTITHADEQARKQQAQLALVEKTRAANPDLELRTELAKRGPLKTTDSQLKAKLIAKAPALKQRLNGPASPKRKENPARLQRMKPIHLPAVNPRLSLPAGSHDAHGALTPELREMYSSVLGQGVQVEQPDGSLLSAEEVFAGVQPPKAYSVASLASDVGMTSPLLGLLPSPTSEDLAETPETRLTPELTALAQSLGGTALPLYNFVHKNVMPELYYGSRKGAASTLASRGGNDFDQASLLIALLRASNIPARYEYGTVRLSLEQAKAWTGAPDATTAAYLLSQAGIPASAGPSGADVLAERVWVRAYVPYGDWRGTGPGGEKVWVRLDPGMKRIAHTNAVNLRGLVHFDFSGYLSGLTQDTPRDIFEKQILQAARARNLCNTVDAALSKSTIAEEDFRLLPAEHPAKVEQSLMLFARPPESFRFFVDVTLDGATQRFELSELQERSLVIRYPGESATDQQAIAAAGSIANVIPYQVHVKPTLFLDGVAVKAFDSVLVGTTEQLDVKVSIAGGAPVAATHVLTAGGRYAIYVAGGAPSAARIATLQGAAKSAAGDDKGEAYGDLVLSLYTRSLSEDVARLYALQGHVAMQDVLEGVAGRDLRVQEAFGTPMQVAWGNYLIDYARDSLTPVPLDANANLSAELVKLSGYQGSALEHKVWEQVLSSKSVSAVKIVQAAASQQVPVYELAPGQLTDRSHLTGFSQSTLDDIDQAIGAGWSVVIPQRPVNYATYQNQEGYILINPVDGTGAFRINLMLNGGGNDDGAPDGGPGDCPVCSGSDQPTGSSVNLANGNWREEMDDLSLPGIGLPIRWGRTYASRSTLLSPLGYGWMSPYGVLLRSELNGDVTYVTEDLREVRFAVGANAAFTPPGGWHLSLTTVSDGYELRTKDQMLWKFASDGTLQFIREPGGNQVTLVYVNGQLSSVKDSSGQVALTLSYVGSKISSVVDRAGRSVSYGYLGDDLVSATDVLGHAETYAYDDAHNLVSRTDRNGKTWKMFYDFRDRWIGERDPLGNEQAASYDVVNRRTVYVDATGAKWLREHNEKGNPTAKVDPLGNREDMTWDGDQNRLTTSDGRGNITTMTYDGAGNVLTQTTPDNRVVTFSYEPTFNRVRTRTETGIGGTTSYFYDAVGRLRPLSEPTGNTDYGYDPFGQLVTVTPAGTQPTRFTYNSDGTLRTMQEPTGGVTTLGYDSAGHLTSLEDANHNVRAMEVDAAGRVKAMVDASLKRTEFTYDDNGNRLTVKDPDNHVTTFKYDDAGRLTQTTDAKGNVTKTQYDAAGRVVASTDARGFTSKTKYDAAGRAIERTASDGSVTTEGYCADIGEPCAEVDGLGNVTTREFDKLGRLNKVTDALGRVSSQTYDNAGHLAATSGPGQVPTTFSYDAFNGREVAVSTPALTTQYQYDGRGNREYVLTNAYTQFEYDDSHRLVYQRNPIGNVETYGYDLAGNRTSKADGKRLTTTYSYDANRQLRVVTFQDATKYEYDYDARGNRTREKSPSHERLLSYDELNRVSTVTDVTLGKTITYGYDAAGNRTSISDGTVMYSYGYDANGRLKTATDGAGRVIAFNYDANGRRSSVVRPNGVRTDYAYDEVGQVKSIVHSRNGAVLAGFSYEYDSFGNRVSKTLADGMKEAYVYDGGHRLTNVTYGAAKQVDYRLDALGNHLSQYESTPGSSNIASTSYSHNGFNQLIALTDPTGTGTTFSYDDNGNLLSETTGTSVKGYTWDLDNRLRSITMPAGEVHRYEYDANGLRTKQVTPAETKKYLLDGMRVFAEYDSAGGQSARYLLNPQGIDEIFSFESGGEMYFPLSDALGSLYVLTDLTGTVVRRYGYDAYGRRTDLGGIGPNIAWGFTGREHDSAGMNYYRDRSMNATTGNWIQPDRLPLAWRHPDLLERYVSLFPAWLASQSDPARLNAYLYVVAPTSQVDPSGLLSPNKFARDIMRVSRAYPAEFVYDAALIAAGLKVAQIGSRMLSIAAEIFQIWSDESAIANVFEKTVFGFTFRVIITFTVSEFVVLGAIAVGAIAAGLFVAGLGFQRIENVASRLGPDCVTQDDGAYL